MPPLKRFSAWLDRAEAALTAVTAGMMVLLSAFIGYQVFARYVLRASPFWVEEFSVTALMWIGLLGAAGCIWTEQHMSIELLRSRLPAKARALVRFVGDLLVVAFSGFLVYHGIILVRRMAGGTLATMSIPLGYTYLALPASGLLMGVFALTKALSRLLHGSPAEGRGTDA